MDDLVKLWPTAPGLAACVAIVWLFMRYLRDRNDRQEKLMERVAETLERSSATLERATNCIERLEHRRGIVP